MPPKHKPEGSKTAMDKLLTLAKNENITTRSELRKRIDGSSARHLHQSGTYGSSDGHYTKEMNNLSTAFGHSVKTYAYKRIYDGKLLLK
jgi:hypothetical protein